MDCAEIRSGFVGGSIPDGPAVAEHLERCPHCRQLFEKGAELGKGLARAVLPEPEPGDLLGAVEGELSREVGVRARLRAWPTRLRAMALVVGLGLLLLGSQLVLLPRSDMAEVGLAFWAIAGLMIAWLLIGSLWQLLGATAPLSTARLGRWMALALLAVPVLAAVMAHEASVMWASPEVCFGYGAAIVVPFVVLAWLFERRDPAPVTSLLVVGALAGIAANLLLHLHCPAVHLGHLLLGHASIGAAWALGLVLLGRFRRPRRDM